MQRVSLEAQYREQVGSREVGRLRRSGKIPAVLYGHDIAAISLSVDGKTMEKVFGNEGFHGLIELKIAGAPKDFKADSSILALIKAFQADPITRTLTHLDLYKVNLAEKVTVTIPVHIEGTAPGVKAGGILEVIRRELEVHCLPNNIPAAVNVDVSELDLGHSIHIEDLKFPENVEVTAETNFTIVAVAAPSKIEEAPPAEAEEGAEAEAAAEGEAKPGEKKAEEKATEKATEEKKSK